MPFFPGQHTRRLAGVLVYILLLAGCASTRQAVELQANPPGSLPLSWELTQTPFYPQQRYQCGPAALATVLKYHEVSITPDELVSQVYVPQREGSLQIEMIAAARQYDMLVYPLRPQLADILFEVAAGRPVLVMQNLSFDWLPVWHYAVVVGYDLSDSEVILRSGTTRRWSSSLAAFERTWARAGYWALVILPPEQIPHTAVPIRYLNAALELEQTGRSGAAYQAYQAAVRHWPDWPQIWFALGNATYERHRYPESVEAFLHATRLDPQKATGWNNLAYALLKLECPQQAKQAVACAARLAPQDSNITDSLTEIGMAQVEKESTTCPTILCPVP